jgi:hypothetical protein
MGDLTHLDTLNLKCEKLIYVPKSIANLKLKVICLLGDKLDKI